MGLHPCLAKADLELLVPSFLSNDVQGNLYSHLQPLTATATPRELDTTSHMSQCPCLGGAFRTCKEASPGPSCGHAWDPVRATILVRWPSGQSTFEDQPSRPSSSAPAYIQRLGDPCRCCALMYRASSSTTWQSSNTLQPTSQSRGSPLAGGTNQETIQPPWQRHSPAAFGLGALRLLSMPLEEHADASREHSGLMAPVFEKHSLSIRPRGLVDKDQRRS